MGGVEGAGGRCNIGGGHTGQAALCQRCLIDRRRYGNALIEQWFGGPNARVRVKPPLHCFPVQEVVQRQKSHCLVVCHIGMDDHPALVIDTDAGRFALRGERWEPWAVNAPRVLTTGDRDLPYLGLWHGGRATLHDARGRQEAELKLPVPSRDVSASVLREGRLHLATAGYGLIWSNVLLLADNDVEGAPAPRAVSSR